MNQLGADRISQANEISLCLLAFAKAGNHASEHVLTMPTPVGPLLPPGRPCHAAQPCRTA
jgi:hypothetical protein